MRIFHKGNFQINTDSMSTDNFYTSAIGDKDGVILSISEGNNDFNISISLDAKSAEKIVNQLEEAIIQSRNDK